jgi:hypothetical protein
MISVTSSFLFVQLQLYLFVFALLGTFLFWGGGVIGVLENVRDDVRDCFMVSIMKFTVN